MISLQIGIVGNNKEQLNVYNEDNPVVMVECNSKVQDAVCFEASSDFLSPVEYRIDIP